MVFFDIKFNMFKKDNLFKVFKLLVFILGIVMLVLIWKIKMIKIVNKIFDWICLILRVFFNNLKNIGYFF